jgi:hypothetical protein
MAENSIFCLKVNEPLDINFNGNPINSGQYWVVYNSIFASDQPICVETVSNVNNTSSQYLADQQYTNCYDCVSNNNGLIYLSNCFESNIKDLFIDVSGLTESQYLEIFSIISGKTEEVLYIEFLSNGTLQKGCFGPKEIDTVPADLYVKLSEQLQFQGQQIVNTLSYTAQTSCESCLTGSSFVYQVLNCTGDIFEYVYLPYNFPEGNLISYTDGINEFCGKVGQQVFEFSGTYTFVTDYGKCDFENCCDICLENVNKRVLLENCSDSGDVVVVWASQLFGVGESSNLEINGGCYRIIGETLDPVTQNGFLDFEPHPGCSSCQTCNGVNYDYFTCDDVFEGYLQTNQVLPFGYEFLNPFDGLTYKLGNQTSTSYDIYISTLQPVSCSGFIPTYKVWLARECYTNTIGPVYTDPSKQSGDFVQIMYGDNDFLCVELIEEVDPTTLGGVYNTKRDGGGNTITYNGCDECINNRTIGVRTVNCDTQELQIVDLNYTAYTELVLSQQAQDRSRSNFATNQFVSFGFNCFLDTNDICRTVVESCPQQPVGNLVVPVENYFSCPTCRAFNPRPEPDPARSAGTEYFECVICCDCGSTGSTVTRVSPPHPVWTDGYGTPVTQMNMVTLGGMFGLNN